MIKDYRVNIPPLFSEVLAQVGGVSPEADFDDIVNASCASFFSFYTPRKLTTAQAERLEKFILHFYIMRRVGSGNVKKFKQIFRNRWNAIIDYYERLIETQENETDYFLDPIENAHITNTVNGSGTVDTTEGTTRNADTDFTTSRTENESGSSSEINRYSDTPQGDSSDIWETYTDEQGNVHVRMNEIYLTDVRGITSSSSRNLSMSGHDITDYDETGSKTVDTDTTHLETGNKTGFEGVSPAELMQKYRETFLRIYEDFVAEFEQCFYNIVEVDDLIDYV